MSSGPEHYRIAEEYLVRATKVKHPENGYALAAIAQVHATLALAAATAANIRRNGALTRGDIEETDIASGWAEVLG